MQSSRSARALAAAILAAAATPLLAETTAKPQVYALLSAVGNRFEVVVEKESTGSHIAPYERRAFEVNQNLLNRLVLQGLDRAVARMDPSSRRVYLSTGAPPARPGARADSQTAPIEPLLGELRKLDRAAWDRIVVAAPAYRSMTKDGLAARLQGLGLFAQPLCQSDTGFGNRVGSCDMGWRPNAGAEARTPSGETIAANSFAAPYSFIEIWVLDARTLEVLDRNQSFSHRKLADAAASLRGVIDGTHRDFLATQIVELITASVDDAVMGSELHGTVEVREKGAVR